MYVYVLCVCVCVRVCVCVLGVWVLYECNVDIKVLLKFFDLYICT